MRLLAALPSSIWALCSSGGRVSEYWPLSWLKRKEGVRIGHEVDSDSIKET